MQYRRFGRTGLTMPVFSCGGMRYQHKWQDTPLAEIPPESQANLAATIRHAVELGINHIETARGYGSSERQLGLVLPKFPREKLIVQTKVAPSAEPGEFIQGFEESLQRLQLRHVDLLAIHGINNAETLHWAAKKGGCLDAARKFQAQGLAKHIGFSTHGPVEVILDAIGHDFDYVNLHWYFIYRRNWPAILEATRRDMGVFIISPSDKGGMLYRPTAQLTKICQPLHPMVFNDLWCLQRPEVHTLSIGAARPIDLDLHAAAADMLHDSQPVVAQIEERWGRALAAAVPEPLRDPFALKLPRWEDTPGQVNLPIILWLRNLVLAYGMREYGQMRYNLLGNGGHWFPGKNAADVDSLDLKSIAETSGLGPHLVPWLKEAHRLLAKEAVKRLSAS